MHVYLVGRNSSVEIAARHWLDGPGIKSRYGRNFSHPSIPALKPIRPSIPAHYPGTQRPRHGVNHPPLSSIEVKGRVQLYCYSRLCRHVRLEDGLRYLCVFVCLFVCLSKMCQVKNLRNCEHANWNVTGYECQQAVLAISKQNRDRIDWAGRLLYCPRFDCFCRIRSKDFLPTDCRYETCHPAGNTVNILTFSKQREVFFKLVPSSFLVCAPIYLDAIFT